MSIDPQRLARSLSSLVQIPSVNPRHAGPVAKAAGPVDEIALATHLAERFDEVGAREVILDHVVDGRSNVYAFVEGRSDRLVGVDVHLDTVTVEHMTDPPFDGRIADGAVWGRGALDTKATLGVLLVLLEDWQRNGLRPEPSLLVVGTIAEEAGGMVGAERFKAWAAERDLSIDQMVTAEPTRLAPVHGHKGGLAFTVTVEGRAAHSALPHLGESAIDAMAPVIDALRSDHERLLALPATNELGTPTMSITLIEGGTGVNVIPDRCTITVLRRNLPGEDPDTEFDRLEQLVADACPLPTTVDVLVPLPSGAKGSTGFYRPADSGLAQVLSSATGRAPEVAPFGTNASRYPDLAREMVVFGPGSIDDAHLATESVRIDDLVTLARAYTDWLQPG